MFDYIEFVICYGEGFTPNMIREKTRKSEIVYTRQLIMYFCKKYNVDSYKTIASEYGQDHATMSHAIKTIENYIDTDKLKKTKIEYYHKIIEQVVKLSKKGEDIKKMIAPLEKQISEMETRCINLTLQLSFIRKKTLEIETEIN